MAVSSSRRGHRTSNESIRTARPTLSFASDSLPGVRRITSAKLALALVGQQFRGGSGIFARLKRQRYQFPRSTDPGHQESRCENTVGGEKTAHRFKTDAVVQGFIGGHRQPFSRGKDVFCAQGECMIMDLPGRIHFHNDIADTTAYRHANFVSDENNGTQR